ncbi:MAG: ABC transporter substrate-binding protein [Blastocatellia bacterium]
MTGSRSTIRACICLLAIALCLAGGCASRKPAPETAAEIAGGREFTDGVGRKVAVRPSPQRVVSLAPNLTEILFAFGLGDRIAGVTSYCDFPEAAKSKEKLGDTLHPNLERIITLKPDLVLITTSSQLEQITRRLDQLSIPVYVTNPRDVREIIASIRALGEVTGATAKADEIAGEMERRVNLVRERVRPLPELRVFYVLQTGPLITAGRNTFINDLINLAGGVSISGQETADYPQFSRETVVARKPEVIVVPSSHGTDLVKEDDLRRDFATTPAVRAGRVVRVNPDWVDRPGPRIVEGLEQLAQGLHPQSP